MKKTLILLVSLLTLQTLSVFASDYTNDLLVHNSYSSSFRKAYVLNPSVPKGILESIAFTQSRFYHLNETQESSCIDYPRAYGVMGLTENGKGYFRNNLITVSKLSGYTVDEIKSNPEKNILAYAKAFSILQQQQNIYGNNIADYKYIFVALSELPVVNDLQNDFVMNAHLYQLYWFLSKGEFQDFYGFPDYQLDLKLIFGNNYDVLSASLLTVNQTQITSQLGTSYRSSGVLSSASVDYGPALSNFTTCNFSSRSGAAITMVAMHFVQGSYAGCISWFKNCSANASAHYVIRSSDGQVTQMVLESNKAWHIGSENPYTLGIEHEGWINDPAWFTNAMYQSSADLTRDMCTSNAINPLRCYFGPGCTGTTAQCSQGTCVKIKGHQMFPNQSHTDPGPNWNWDRFYKLLNNTPTITNVTSTSGTFYDTGGASANYGNDERRLWLFQPSGATSISMNFTSFNLENNYDYMFIYDGSTVNSPLIGKYTNNVSPGNINSTGSSLLVEFRSDCATTQAGWVATYTSNATPTNTTLTDHVAPTTSIVTSNAWETASFSASYTDADNAGGSGVSDRFYQVIDFNGTEWRGNHKNGFFSDNFDSAIHPEWTQASGAWGINNNALEQTLEAPTTASNTNIYAALTQTLSTKYLYNFKGKIEGTGTNRRAGFHFFIDNPTLPNRGNSYFVFFRLDAPKVQIYKTVNDVFYLKADSGNNVSINAGQWYDYKVIFDRLTGKISVYKDNTLAATWTDNTPLATGDIAPLANGSYISFRSGNCVWSLDEIKVYRSRTTTTTSVSVGTANTNDVRYQNPNPTQNACRVKSVVRDVAGNISPIFYDDINIDWTNPTNFSVVRDSKAADVFVVNTKDSLSANWPKSTDPNSAISRYWYSIGSAPSATNVLGWTSNWGDTIATANNLMLKHDTVYYFNIKSENGAGLFSNVISSNGQKVDTTAVPIGIKEFTDSNLISVYPNPFNQSVEISLPLKKDCEVELTLIDVLGRELKRYQSKESKGIYHTKIDGNSLNLSSGIYWIKIKLDNELLCKKIVKH